MPSLDLVTTTLDVLGPQLAGVVLNAAVGIVVVLGLRALRDAREEPSSRLRRVLSVVGTLVVAVAAFAVLADVLKNRADTLTGALGRWNHWILCALVGQLLVLVAQRWNIRALVLLSLVFVGT
jgi:hypothetical protein